MIYFIISLSLLSILTNFYQKTDLVLIYFILVYMIMVDNLYSNYEFIWLYALF